ncbi:MAG: hypothetical protein L3J76_02405 [Candidatus Hydrothermae bacterium]|nr:hypothetical protein [Candidatus Hydrothermae bacterium]
MVRFFHILAASVWVGGNLLFFVALRRARPEDRPVLYRSLGRTFRGLSWAALALLGATGMLLLRGFSAEVYRLKFLLVSVAVLLKAGHDLVLAPRARRTGRHRTVLGVAYTLLLLELWILYEAVAV